MRVVIQRVLRAEVLVDGSVVGRIDVGLLVYLGVAEGDTVSDAAFIADKLVDLRVFADEAGKMNRSVLDVGGGILLVSQFTLCGDCRRGRRPGFDLSAEPGWAQELYEKVAVLVRDRGVEVAKGVFGAHMAVSSVNDGPVTFLLDSGRLF